MSTPEEIQQRALAVYEQHRFGVVPLNKLVEDALTSQHEATIEASDDMWLTAIANGWQQINGVPWDVMDGETREEGIAHNVAVLIRASETERDFQAKLTRLLVAAEGDDLLEVVENICNQRDALARQVEELSKYKEMLDTIEAECWDVRCYDVPTGGGDCDVRWGIIAHHMAAPQEREVGMGGDTPREAITSAMKGEVHE